MIDLNAREFLHGDACQILEEILHGDAKFPVTKNTVGVPKSLGDLARGCQILGGTGSPMTLGTI